MPPAPDVAQNKNERKCLYRLDGDGFMPPGRYVDGLEGGGPAQSLRWFYTVTITPRIIPSTEKLSAAWN